MNATNESSHSDGAFLIWYKNYFTICDTAGRILQKFCFQKIFSIHCLPGCFFSSLFQYCVITKSINHTNKTLLKPKAKILNFSNNSSVSLVYSFFKSKWRIRKNRFGCSDIWYYNNENFPGAFELMKLRNAELNLGEYVFAHQLNLYSSRL